jgi:hypothetical protein
MLIKPVIGVSPVELHRAIPREEIVVPRPAADLVRRVVGKTFSIA